MVDKQVANKFMLTMGVFTSMVHYGYLFDYSRLSMESNTLLQVHLHVFLLILNLALSGLPYLFMYAASPWLGDATWNKVFIPLTLIGISYSCILYHDNAHVFYPISDVPALLATYALIIYIALGVFNQWSTDRINKNINNA